MDITWQLRSTYRSKAGTSFLSGDKTTQYFNQNLFALSICQFPEQDVANTKSSVYRAFSF